MPVLRECQTAVIARNQPWVGAAETEPYEAAWAKEVIIFFRWLELDGGGPAQARVQISPDGLHWVDEGAVLELPAAAGAVSFVRLGHFGQFVRLKADLPDGLAGKVIVTLNAKG